MSESRVPENGTHGSIGGRWQRRQTKRGPLVPGRCAGKRHHDGLDGTSTATVSRPSQRPPHRKLGCGGWDHPRKKGDLTRPPAHLRQIAHLGPRHGASPTTRRSRPTPAWTCTSAIRAALGSAGRTRTPTGSCATTRPRVRPWPRSPRTTLTSSPPGLPADHARRSTSKPSRYPPTTVALTALGEGATQRDADPDPDGVVDSRTTRSRSGAS